MVMEFLGLKSVVLLYISMSDQMEMHGVLTEVVISTVTLDQAGYKFQVLLLILVLVLMELFGL